MSSSVRSKRRRDVAYRWRTYFTDIHVPKSIFVDTEAENRWANRNLDPIPPEKCNWREIDFVSYWLCDLFALPTWSTVSTVMLAGFSARQTVPICIIGFSLCGVVITLTTLVGCQYRVPYPVASRIAFGLWGSIPAICARCFVALMWLSILTCTGGRLMEVLLSALFPSFLTMHNPFPASANITPPELIAFFIYWALQSFCSFLSIEKIRMLILVKAITITPTFLILLVWAVTVTKGGGKLVNGPTEMTYEYGAGWAWVSGICHVAGLFSTLSVNMPDFGRYSRDERGGTSQVWAFPLLGSLAAVTPIFVTSAGQELWGELIWDFPTLLHKFDSRTAKFFVAAAFVLATLGNQLGADCIPFANDSMALAPRYINRFRANTFAAVVCVISTPWNIIRSGQGFITFLLGYASYTSCLAAIMVADFFVVKRQKVDVCELYKPYGLYWYTHGWNWRAYVAFFVGFIPSVPGFAKSIDDSLNIGTAWVPFQMAWIFGTVVSFTTYILVNLVWPDPARVYEAVKPHEIFAQRRRARAVEKARRKLLKQQQQEQQQQESATVDFDARSMSKGSMPTTPGDGLAAAEGSSTINGVADTSTVSNPYFVNALTSHNGSGEDLRTVEKEIIELYETDRRHPQRQTRNSPSGPHHNSSKVE